nr:MAG TPA: 60S ribosomal protein L2-A [Crassvirales sp.]
MYLLNLFIIILPLSCKYISRHLYESHNLLPFYPFFQSYLQTIL